MLAPRAVREGNRFLEGGDPAAALQRYGEARQLAPDAREIAFDEGLAHFALSEYDKARESFDRAAQGKADPLADDALYSAGTCDHAEAVAPSTDPKQSLSKLESAMQKYQSVLSREENHAAARDAHYKASSLWRELKQQQQQQQQQSDQQNDSKENQEKQEQSQQQQQSSQEKNEKQEQQQQSQQDQQQEQQAQQQEKQDQQQQQAEKQDEQREQDEESQQAQEQKEEDASREQAERKLREIMQTQKDRKKLRPEDVRKPQVQPVAKDW
jgi:Ca-activated chloride channel family protein